MGFRKNGGRSLRVAASALASLVFFSCGGEDTSKPADLHAPELAQPSGLSATEETVETVDVNAVDPDGDAVTLAMTGLPGFASFADHGDGTGTLTLAPILGDAGSYPGVTIKADDGELSDSLTATLTVTPLPRIDGALFYEPITVCIAPPDGPDTLLVYNLSDATLYWRPVKVPPGAAGLDRGIQVDPRSIAEIPWTWTPEGALPLVDTLVVLTNDRERPRVAIPFRATTDGAVDIYPPPAPHLLFPEDGAVFTLEPSDTTDYLRVDIDIAWSTIDDCSGTQYWLEISRTPVFPAKPIRFIVRTTAVTAIAEYLPDPGGNPEPDDRGIAYWRVFAKDDAGLIGPYSEVRTWRVVEP